MTVPTGLLYRGGARNLWGEKGQGSEPDWELRSSWLSLLLEQSCLVWPVFKNLLWADGQGPRKTDRGEGKKCVGFFSPFFGLPCSVWSSQSRDPI